ncbi:DUF2478 domain-containing protein [Thauera linaloolentis]|uniref:Molybdenum ABC transporter ATP-binding protein n=1 Tax=Thauera linaloolentis (strain DSM 12138 / JCM 21573 / CCUG 41526 / CIP 105981 / IAM 15112 / NBRC 102519 / 47Lol) TaxID=1123367 RepID=N6XZR4_THAL4|nr:DUF2478 domain-containing protein [Thauera linaloolentis]ENO87341.1 molybdenum ABC transporter ATP-binding protein [Thauera linaloolentis 47Lol = DSM 12138]MCM8565455.1 DUF2478 domain-containing protein [Thauera linaloolentis]
MKAPFSTASAPSTPPLAAIVHRRGDQADELLARFALDLRDSGWRIHGVVQRHCGSRRLKAALIDLDTGLHFPLFHQTGRWSLACSPDPGCIMAASATLRTALETRSDLAVANRFGTLEAVGSGLAAEMLALINEGQPLLTVVSEAYLADWRDFTGGQGAELPPRRAALDDWFVGVTHARHAS